MNPHKNKCHRFKDHRKIEKGLLNWACLIWNVYDKDDIVVLQL